MSYDDIVVYDPDIVVMSEASLTGWGSFCNDARLGRQWLPGEQQCHINYLELKAAGFALQSFQEHLGVGGGGGNMSG